MAVKDVPAGHGAPRLVKTPTTPQDASESGTDDDSHRKVPTANPSPLPNPELRATGDEKKHQASKTQTEQEDAAQEDEPRWEWIKRAWAAFMEAGLPVQGAVVGAIIVPLCWGLGFLSPAKKAAVLSQKGRHHVAGFGPDGYPVVPISERRITDRDVSALLKQAGHPPGPDAAQGQLNDAGAESFATAAASRGPQPTVTEQIERSQPRTSDTRSQTQSHSARRASSPPPVVASARRVRSARLYSPGGTLKGSEDGSEKASRVPAGTRIEAVLEIGVSSAHREAVVGRVDKDVVSPKGDVLVASGDYLMDRARADVPAGRMFLSFNQLVRGDKATRLEGYAVSEGETGIAAEIHAPTAHDKQGQAVRGGIVDTAQDATSLLPSLVRHIVRRSVTQARSDLPPTSSQTLLLPSQTRFEVLITG